MNLAQHEQAKYTACWSDDRYRQYSPGVEALWWFRKMNRKRSGTLVDIGAGTGRATLDLQEMGYDVTALDFASNALEADIPFLEVNIWGNWPARYFDHGYCCDVMEHIPPQHVENALENISAHTQRCFFAIHFGPDHFGRVIGHPLHLTIQPFEWWRDALGVTGTVQAARDLLGWGVFDVRY